LFETVYTVFQIFKILKKYIQERYQTVDIFYPDIYSLPLVFAEFGKYTTIYNQSIYSFCIGPQFI